MLVKILIKRRFQEGKRKEIVAILNDMRSKAMSHTGYVSGQTLVNPADYRDFLVISTWQSMEAWHSWKESEARKNLEAMLEIYQDDPTVYEEYVLGTPFHE